MADTSSVDSAAPKVCVVVIDGLPRGLLSETAAELTFLRERTPHWTQAVAVALLLAGAWLSVRSAPGPGASKPAP